MALAHHILFALSVAALLGAGSRVAGCWSRDPLERWVAAAVLAAGAACVEALVLGLFALGGSWVALSAAAALTWLATLQLPRPAHWSVSIGRPLRVAAGALIGLAVAWAAWQLHRPALGFDELLYHLPESLAWVHDGTPGSIEPILPGISGFPPLPVGNYPLTDEVLVSWQLALARSFVPVTVWPWALLGLTAMAGWLGLRALRVGAAYAALAVAAVVTSPALLAWQSNGASTDPPALCWLVCCAALCAAATKRPWLLAPALISAGLSVGSKTTTLPLALVAVAVTLGVVRRRLPWRPVAAGLAGALAVGGVWYLRNLIQHGSPLWPFYATPWGDPLPSSVEAVKHSLLDRPRMTLDRVGGDWLAQFAGGFLLVMAGGLAPLAAWRRPAVMAAAAATALGFLAWARAPVTGVSDFPGLDPATVSTTRYLLPAAAAGALAVALVTRVTPLAAIPLAAATVLNLAQQSLAPPLGVLAIGLAAGAALALALTLPRLPRLPRVPAVTVAVALGALLAIPAGGYVERFARSETFGAPVSGWIATQPGYGDSAPVWFQPVMVATLSGDRLQHPLRQLSTSEPCSGVASRARRGWLVVYRPFLREGRPGECLGPRARVYGDATFAVYTLRSSVRRGPAGPALPPLPPGARGGAPPGP